MKNKILTLAASVLLMQTLLAQESPTARIDEKKIIIGAGISDHNITEGFGANLKCDYLLTNKFSVGLRSIYTSNSGWTRTPSALEYGPPFYAVDTKPSRHLNTMLVSTFCIFGKNSLESKGGVYASIGAGYRSLKTSTTITSAAPEGDTLYYKYSKDNREKDFAGLVSIGGDLKLGPGKIYFEVPFTFNIYGGIASKYYDGVGEKIPNNSSPYNTWFPFSLENGLFLNVGYQFYF